MATRHALLTTQHPIPGTQSVARVFKSNVLSDLRWCIPGTDTIVSVTNFCAPNYGFPSDAGGKCNIPNKHFVLPIESFEKIAIWKAANMPIQYRSANVHPVSCKLSHGITCGDVVKSTLNKWRGMARIWGLVAGKGLDSVAINTARVESRRPENGPLPRWEKKEDRGSCHISLLLAMTEPDDVSQVEVFVIKSSGSVGSFSSSTKYEPESGLYTKSDNFSALDKHAYYLPEVITVEGRNWYM
ncbi:hypothetical protein POTOM_060174 [Populus tomentosa]|uniref:Expansin n=1 Tax=Populus tomentosa TaxID=118781 RepID=A0A8X7XN56_POPTO|nr:hypothetical protein POTOM_060174 [Populus tomentosa]